MAQHDDPPEPADARQRREMREIRLSRFAGDVGTWVLSRHVQRTAGKAPALVVKSHHLFGDVNGGDRFRVNLLQQVADGKRPMALREWRIVASYFVRAVQEPGKKMRVLTVQPDIN